MMSSKKNVVLKRSGRPATGQDPVTAIRLSQELRTNVDAWAATEDDELGCSEAIRRLVELGLKVQAPTKPIRSIPNKVRAVERAAIAIEKMIDLDFGRRTRSVPAPAYEGAAGVSR